MPHFQLSHCAQDSVEHSDQPRQLLAFENWRTSRDSWRMSEDPQTFVEWLLVPKEWRHGYEELVAVVDDAEVAPLF